MIAWQIFREPMSNLGANHIWLVLPLCAVLAAVYKTIRVKYLRRLPMAILGLWGYMLGGFIVLGVAFWLLVEYFNK